ncbi:MAG: hypothetical protein HYR59_08485 [Acidobacteria bacterium]|nr:hypothetical protein [Acidobacteriota bacterium]
MCPYCGTDLSGDAQAGEAPPKKTNWIAVVIRYAILLGAIWGFMWYVVPERRGGEAAAQAEERAIRALRDAGASLAVYADAQGGSFPPSIEALSGASGERMKQAAQTALAEGYQLEYTVRPADASGAYRQYTLLARPRNWGYRNFYLDETGVLRATRENRPASAQDPPL